MSIPRKDSELVNWSGNFSTRISAAPADFNVSAAQASAYDVKNDLFVTAYNAQQVAFEAGNRSKSLTTSKNQAKAQLLLLGRELYAFIQDSLTVTDANKNLVGVKVKKTENTPQPVPSQKPGLDIVSVFGRTVRVKLHDSENSNRRAMPEGVDGATIVSCVSESEPTSGANWKWQGNTGRLVADITFADTVEAGAKVWVAACWFNQAKQAGQFCTPVSTNLQGGAQAAA